MSTVTLRVRAAPGFRVDGSALLPATLAALPDAEIGRVLLPASNDLCALGDLFDISRTESDEPALVIEGDVRWLDRLGAAMASGNLRVAGSAGDYAGLRMSGGELRIEGDAGMFTGAELRGGRIDVTGDAGDFAAGALPGDMEGMSGGTLSIEGSAGARLGDRMRRGAVLVGGNAGDYAGSRMVAGTIAIAGTTGAHIGYGMRRGTLLLLNAPARIPPTFTEGGRGFDVFWSLLVRSFAKERVPFALLAAHALPRRFAGDLAVDGRGELLIAG